MAGRAGGTVSPVAQATKIRPRENSVRHGLDTPTGYQHVHAHAHAHLHAHVLCAQGQHPKQRMQRLECLEPGAVVGRDLRAREEPHRQRRALQGCVLGVCERYRSAGSLRVRAATRPCVAAKATLNRLSYEPMRSRLYTMGACACAACVRSCIM